MRWSVAAVGRDRVGEGPLWVSRENALYWVDIAGRRLHRLQLADGERRDWDFAEDLGFVAERARGGLVVGLASGVATLSFEPFSLTPLRPLARDLAVTRLNDATVDAAGRLWIGSMTYDGSVACGRLHRLDGDLRDHVVDEGYLIPNGPTFSADGRTLYHADSLRRIVYRFHVSPEGRLMDRKVHIGFRDERWGLPDGTALDAEGCLWVAHWDGGRISRFDPEGGLIDAIRLPVSRVTSCAFGGANLDRLFVTTAAQGREDESLAGSLFEVETGAQGLNPWPFAG